MLEGGVDALDAGHGQFPLLGLLGGFGRNGRRLQEAILGGEEELGLLPIVIGGDARVVLGREDALLRLDKQRIVSLLV